MSTKKWLNIPPEVVELRSLRFSQDHLYISGLLAAANGAPSYCGDPYPHVVRFNNELWLDDGHHRAVIAAIRGEKAIEARVLRKD